MADVTIPGLTPITTISGSALLIVDTGVQTFKITAQQLAHSLESLMDERVTETLKGAGSFTVPPGTTAIRVRGVKRPDGAFTIKPAGDAWTVGANFFGDLGDNTQTDRSSPVATFGGHTFDWMNIYQNLAIKADGSAWTWGGNTNGQLGDGTILNKSIPIAVIGGHQFQKILCPNGQARIGLKTNGAIFSWGPNGGNFGDGTIASRSSPTAAIGGHAFVDVVGSASVVGALKPDGSVWMWGDNQLGALGDGTIAPRSSPVATIGGHKFVKISQFELTAVGLKANGSLWAWGQNNFGQVGDGTTANRSSPVAVIGGHQFVDFISTAYNVIALKADGSAWAWGGGSLNGHGGPATAAGNRSSPVAVVGGHFFDTLVRTEDGNDIVMAIKPDGSVWAWGNSAGLLDGTTASRSSPVAAIGGHFFEGIHMVNNAIKMVKRNGSVWGVGSQFQGQLGDGTVADRSSPVAMIGGHVFGKQAPAKELVAVVQPSDVIPYSVHEGIFGPLNLGRGYQAFAIDYWIVR